MKRLRYVRLSAGRRAAIWGIFLLAAVMGLMCVAVLHMKPILTNLAAASVSNTVKSENSFIYFIFCKYTIRIFHEQTTYFIFRRRHI